MLSRHNVGIHQGNKLTSNWSGNNRTPSSQLAQPPWTGSKSAIGVHEMISTLKKTKQAGTDSSKPSPKSLYARKALPPPTPSSKRNKALLPYLTVVSRACHPGGQRAEGQGAGAGDRSDGDAPWDWSDTRPPAATQTP